MQSDFTFGGLAEYTISYRSHDAIYDKLATCLLPTVPGRTMLDRRKSSGDAGTSTPHPISARATEFSDTRHIEI